MRLRLPLHKISPTCTVFLDDCTLAVGSTDLSIAIYSTTNPSLVAYLDGLDAEVTSMSHLPNLSKIPSALVSASSDGSLAIWDTNSLKLLRLHKEAHNAKILSVLALTSHTSEGSPKHFIVSIDALRFIKIWQINEEEEDLITLSLRLELKNPFTPNRVAPLDPQTFMVLGVTTVGIWSTTTCPDFKEIAQLSVRPDRRILLVHPGNPKEGNLYVLTFGCIYIFDAHTFKPKKEIPNAKIDNRVENLVVALNDEQVYFINQQNQLSLIAFKGTDEPQITPVTNVSLIGAPLSLLSSNPSKTVIAVFVWSADKDRVSLILLDRETQPLSPPSLANESIIAHQVSSLYADDFFCMTDNRTIHQFKKRKTTTEQSLSLDLVNRFCAPCHTRDFLMLPRLGLAVYRTESLLDGTRLIARRIEGPVTDFLSRSLRPYDIGTDLVADITEEHSIFFALHDFCIANLDAIRFKIKGCIRVRNAFEINKLFPVFKHKVAGAHSADFHFFYLNPATRKNFKTLDRVYNLRPTKSFESNAKFQMFSAHTEQCNQYDLIRGNKTKIISITESFGTLQIEISPDQKFAVRVDTSPGSKSRIVAIDFETTRKIVVTENCDEKTKLVFIDQHHLMYSFNKRYLIAKIVFQS